MPPSQNAPQKSTNCMSYRSECLMSFCCVILVAILIVTMASEDSYFEMCDNVPCGGTTAAARPKEIPCQYEDQGVRLLKQKWPEITVPECSDAQHLTRECIVDTCSAYKEILLDSKSVVQLELACMHQIRLDNGEYVSFGSICCSVCRFLVDYEEVFRTWASAPPKQSCGLFTCVRGNSPSKDICAARSSHIKAAQAFSILTTLLIGFLSIFHALSAWQGTISKDSNSRIPLPRQVLSLRKWVHEKSFVLHGIAAIFCFVAAVLMMASLARKLCDIRYAEYVRTGYAARSFWFCMTIEFLFACNCFLRINTVKQAGEVKAVPAQTSSRGMRQAVENPIDSNLQMDDGINVTPVLSHSSAPREEEPAPVELRAMSPADVSLEVKDEQRSSDTPTSTTPKPPPPLS
eukprot:TRINITY_DN4451_c0_g2_i1.p1 TRINITY_DN4451_c0_g2~~TRINITY_DN4451_c0_g2_i1.p1  ORF type:complete len:418 (+),score=69.25 TRINITY_DN4451_c0_g2_i1:44-1255(+)